MTDTGGSFLKDHKRDKKKPAFIVFFNNRPVESFAFVVVVLLLVFKSCAMNAARDPLARWSPGSPPKPADAGKKPQIWGSAPPPDFLPPPPDRSVQSRPFLERRGQPITAALTSQALATPGSGPSSLHLALAGGLQQLPSTRSIPPPSGGRPPIADSAEGRDPLGLIERGSFPSEEAPVLTEQYREVPQGLEGQDLIEAMKDDGLMKELKDYAKHETWRSLEKATGQEQPLPAGLNGFKNSKVVIEILKTRRATDSALYCGSACKLEKRIRNNRAPFYGEKY